VPPDPFEFADLTLTMAGFARIPVCAGAAMTAFLA